MLISHRAHLLELKFQNEADVQRPDVDPGDLIFVLKVDEVLPPPTNCPTPPSLSANPTAADQLPTAAAAACWRHFDSFLPPACCCCASSHLHAAVPSTRTCYTSANTDTDTQITATAAFTHKHTHAHTLDGADPHHAVASAD